MELRYNKSEPFLSEHKLLEHNVAIENEVIYNGSDNDNDEVLSRLTSSMSNWSSLRGSRLRAKGNFGDDSDDEETKLNEEDGVSEPKRSIQHKASCDALFCLKCMYVPKLRQEWVHCNDGLYLNSSIHDERRARWMDLLFDLVLVGFQHHIWELFIQMMYDVKKNFTPVGFLFSGYGIVAILWQTSQTYRNRYHSSGSQDTLILCIMIVLAIFAIRKLHNCTEGVVCSQDISSGVCNDVSLGVAMLYVFYGVLNLWVGSANKKFRMNNVYESVWFLVAAVGWVVIRVAPREWFQLHYIVSTVSILIFRPLIVSKCKTLKKDFQPQNISYLRERLGLLVIANLAIAVDQSFEAECDMSKFKLCDHKHNGSNAIYNNGSGFVEPGMHQWHHLDTHTIHVGDHNDEEPFTRFLLSIAIFLLAFWIKVVYFNVYDYSTMEDQVTRRTYQSINGVHLLLVYFLAIGLSLLSADEKVTLCSIYLEKAEGFPIITYVLPVTIITTTFTIHHYINTRRAKEKWKGRFCIFICLRACIIIVCTFFHSYTAVHDDPREAKRWRIPVFILTFSISLFIEHNVLKLPTRYRANRDKILRKKLLHIEKDEKNRV